MRLPPGVTVLERGWLSSNNILPAGRDCATPVDSSYGAHAPLIDAWDEAAASRGIDGRRISKGEIPPHGCAVSGSFSHTAEHRG